MAIDPQSRLVIIEKPKKLELNDPAKNLYIREERKIIAFNAAQGLPGRPGDGQNFVLNSPVNFGDICYFKDGNLHLASCTDPEFISLHPITYVIAQGTGIAGQEVFFKYHGELIFPTPSLLPGTDYFLAEDGKITDTPPTSCIMLLVGTAITETRFFVNFQPPILLRG